MSVKELGEVDVVDVSDDELTEVVVELVKLRSALEAEHARLAAAWARRRSWAPQAKTAAAWLTATTKTPRGAIGSLLWLGREVAFMPLVEEAWRAGDLTEAHVRRLARVRNPRTCLRFGDDEALLVHLASTLTFSDFDQAVSYWQQMADPDGAAEDDMERAARRRVSLDETISGMWSGSVLLDPIPGTVVARELRRLERALFESDWAEAKERLGRDPQVIDLARTPDQRRADALVEMARRSARPDTAGKKAKPLVTLLLGSDTLRRLCEIEETGRVVSPRYVKQWLDDADLETIVFDGTGQRAIRVSRKRTFKGALRRVIEVRDRECYHPYCDVRAPDCQGDHIKPCRHGGLTCQENGRLACGYHNRLRNITDDPPADDSS